MASLVPAAGALPPSFARFPVKSKNLVVRSWNVSFLRLLVDSLVVRVFKLAVFLFSVVAEAKKQFFVSLFIAPFRWQKICYYYFAVCLFVWAVPFDLFCCYFVTGYLAGKKKKKKKVFVRNQPSDWYMYVHLWPIE